MTAYTTEEQGLRLSASSSTLPCGPVSRTGLPTPTKLNPGLCLQCPRCALCKPRWRLMLRKSGVYVSYVRSYSLARADAPHPLLGRRTATRGAELVHAAATGRPAARGRIQCLLDQTHRSSSAVGPPALRHCGHRRGASSARSTPQHATGLGVQHCTCRHVKGLPAWPCASDLSASPAHS